MLYFSRNQIIILHLHHLYDLDTVILVIGDQIILQKDLTNLENDPLILENDPTIHENDPIIHENDLIILENVQIVPKNVQIIQENDIHHANQIQEIDHHVNVHHRMQKKNQEHHQDTKNYQKSHGVMITVDNQEPHQGTQKVHLVEDGIAEIVALIEDVTAEVQLENVIAKNVVQLEDVIKIEDLVENVDVQDHIVKIDTDVHQNIHKAHKVPKVHKDDDQEIVDDLIVEAHKDLNPVMKDLTIN